MASAAKEDRPSPLIIPELLEAILLYVDERTLLVSAQRVSRHWRAVIDVSPSLQWKLFLRPDYRAATARAPRQNPLLAKAFPFCFDEWPNGVLLAPQNRTRALVWAMSDTAAAEPPVLGRGLPCPWSPVPQWPHLWTGREAFKRPDASWRRMLVHQPPVFLTEVLATVDGGFPQSWIYIGAPGVYSYGENEELKRPPATPCRMQALVKSVFREFRARFSEGNNFKWAEMEAVDLAGRREDEWCGRTPNVAGFKVIWDLRGPPVGERLPVVEDAYSWYHDTDSEKDGVQRQYVLVLHDVEILSVAPLDRQFVQLREMLCGT